MEYGSVISPWRWQIRSYKICLVGFPELFPTNFETVPPHQGAMMNSTSAPGWPMAARHASNSFRATGWTRPPQKWHQGASMLSCVKNSQPFWVWKCQGILGWPKHNPPPGTVGSSVGTGGRQLGHRWHRRRRCATAGMGAELPAPRCTWYQRTGWSVKDVGKTGGKHGEEWWIVVKYGENRDNGEVGWVVVNNGNDQWKIMGNNGRGWPRGYPHSWFTSGKIPVVAERWVL